MTDGQNGFVIENPGDWEQLARHLEALTDRATRFRMGVAAKAGRAIPARSQLPAGSEPLAASRRPISLRRLIQWAVPGRSVMARKSLVHYTG